MANEFVGSTVLVTLRVPPNSQVKGVVLDIQDKILYLRDVTWIASGLYMSSFEVPNDVLFDLEVMASDPGDFKPSPLISASSPSIAPAEIKPQQPIPFVDPAILSMSKPPPKDISHNHVDSLIALTEPLEISDADIGRSGTLELDSTEPKAAPIQKAFQELISRKLQLDTNNGLFITTPDGEIASASRHSTLAQTTPDAPSEKRKSGKSRGRKARPSTHGDLLTVEEPVARKSKKGAARKHTTRLSEAQNGWATEEATDIQELGDFDFAANLSKFDKREIFRQLKQDDTVAPGDRLVGHNRLPKPGTNGGRNLHWTENVLDTPAQDNDAWNSEAGETADDYVEVLERGKLSMRKKSHSQTRLGASRKGSHNTEDALRRQSQMTTRQASFDVASPGVASRKSFASPYLGSIAPTQKSSLHILETDQACPTLSPVQMLELEQHAMTDLGLNEEILSENAARGITELIMQLRAMQRSLSEFHVAVAVGSHKTGARAMAAARHLCNRGFKVTCVVLGREEDYPEAIKKQAASFRKAGGRLSQPAGFIADFNAGVQPSLFVDALTGIHTSFEDLRHEDRQWYVELSIALSRVKTPILSIDVPSGIDASTGTPSTIDGETVVLQPDMILALGAPKTYLPRFLEDSKPTLRAYVADISIGRNAWKHFSGKRRMGLDFGDCWLVELRLTRVDET